MEKIKNLKVKKDGCISISSKIVLDIVGIKPGEKVSISAELGKILIEKV